MISKTVVAAISLMSDMCGYPEEARGMEAMAAMLQALDENTFDAMSEDEAADWIAQYLPCPKKAGEVQITFPEPKTAKKEIGTHPSYVRLGGSVKLTKDEIAALRLGDETSKDTLLNALRDGRVTLDGLVSFNKALNVFSSEFSFDKKDHQTLFVK